MKLDVTPHDMSSSDPFTRMFLKLQREREKNPCLFTWPCLEKLDPGETHEHRCCKHGNHGQDHKCACGVVRKRRRKRQEKAA